MNSLAQSRDRLVDKVRHAARPVLVGGRDDFEQGDDAMAAGVANDQRPTRRPNVRRLRRRHAATDSRWSFFDRQNSASDRRRRLATGVKRQDVGLDLTCPLLALRIKPSGNSPPLRASRNCVIHALWKS